MSLAECCTDRFECLKPIYANFLFSDLKHLQPADLELLVSHRDNPQLFLLNLIFVRTHLKRYFKGEPEEFVADWTLKDHGLTLRMYRLDEPTSILPDLLSVTQNLDISNLDLLDRHFTEEILVLLAAVLKQCLIVDVSCNCLSNSEATILKMLQQFPQIQFVNIQRNRLATIDRKDWLAKLDADILKKLIWVPEFWLQDGGWKELIRQELHATVIAAHTRYYETAYARQATQ